MGVGTWGRRRPSPPLMHSRTLYRGALFRHRVMPKLRNRSLLSSGAGLDGDGTRRLNRGMTKARSQVVSDWGPTARGKPVAESHRRRVRFCLCYYPAKAWPTAIPNPIRQESGNGPAGSGGGLDRVQPGLTSASTGFHQHLLIYPEFNGGLTPQAFRIGAKLTASCDWGSYPAPKLHSLGHRQPWVVLTDPGLSRGRARRRKPPDQGWPAAGRAAGSWDPPRAS